MGITSIRPFFSAEEALRSMDLPWTVARHRVQVVRRLDELQQAVALRLDDLALLLLQQRGVTVTAPLDGLGEDPVQV